MSEAWPTHVEVVRSQLQQAETDAVRLGHDLRRWEPIPQGKPTRYEARCTRCGAAVVVSPRQWRRTTFAGSGLILRCA